jgi:hypothetical protein
MGETLDAVLSTIREASAGGHARMGGGRLSLREGSIETVAGEQISRDDLRERLFEVLEGDV